ncbi:hypothetical protein CFP56_031089 [Quercus suber]|uniref:F-box associated domain-containing protein n=1 Tax=Quercus suber TaxID=58331 RepID=A0AAW0LTV5_QUESU
MVLSTEVDDLIQNGMEVPRNWVEVNEIGSRENVVGFSSEAWQTLLPRDGMGDGLADGVGQDRCGFVDLGYSGPNFTWHGCRRGELIWERLDRGVANYEWLARFPTRRIRHLHCFTSDHRLILLSLDSNGKHQRWRRKPFQFEAIWLTSLDCNDVISRAWAINHDGTLMHVEYSHERFNEGAITTKQVREKFILLSCYT